MNYVDFAPLTECHLYQDGDTLYIVDSEEEVLKTVRLPKTITRKKFWPCVAKLMHILNKHGFLEGDELAEYLLKPRKEK